MHRLASRVNTGTPDSFYAAMTPAELERALDDIGFKLSLAGTMEQRAQLMQQAREAMQEQERRGTRNVK